MAGGDEGGVALVDGVAGDLLGDLAVLVPEAAGIEARIEGPSGGGGGESDQDSRQRVDEPHGMDSSDGQGEAPGAQRVPSVVSGHDAAPGSGLSRRPAAEASGLRVAAVTGSVADVAYNAQIPRAGPQGDAIPECPSCSDSSTRRTSISTARSRASNAIPTRPSRPSGRRRGGPSRRLVELAIEERVAFVLLAGDLYDGDWKDYNTGLFFVAQMRRLADAGIPVFLVSGNHDAASQITKRLSLPPNVHHHASRQPETVELPDYDVAIHGQSFAARRVPDDLAAGYPQADRGRFEIGLLHTSLDGRPGHADYAPCTVEGLRAKGYAYWALGHVHQREIVPAAIPGSSFPGNLQGRHARETGGKGASLVSVDHGRVVDVVHHDLDVVRWARVEVDPGGPGPPRRRAGPRRSRP